MTTTLTPQRKNPKERSLRARPLLWLLIAAISTWLLPQKAVCGNFVDEPHNYQLMLNGANTIRFKVPVFNEDMADHWVYDGYIYVSVEDENGNFGQDKILFGWNNYEGNHDNDRNYLWVNFMMMIGGTIDITQGNSSDHFSLTTGQQMRRKVYENTDGETYDITGVWRLPYDLLGKTLKFTWDVRCDYTNGLAWDTYYPVSISAQTITIPPAQDVVSPQVTTATISYSESGKLELPWFIASSDVTAAHYEYTDHNGMTVAQAIPADVNSGTIYLDANIPHDDFRIVVSYKDNSGYDIENISSEVQDLPMIHAPVGLTATPTGNSKAAVRLAWSILYPGKNDIVETDFFEVQRSVSGEEDDFETIGTVPFNLDPDNILFEFIDSTFCEAVTAAQLQGGGTLDHLTYRVRRLMTQNWGWDENNCASSASCVVDDIHLLRISNYTAQWDDERAYTVRVSWDYANERNAVWDERAQMKLLVRMKNREGEVVDSLLYDLNADERSKRYKVVNLSRACVDYDIKMYVERGTTPLGSYEDMTPYYFPIRTTDDWNKFRQMVISAKGQKDVNARLYADISTDTSCGDSNSPFRGHFDGNGHTLTMNINASGEFEAPFKYAKDYTIENLTVKGTIKGGQHSAGLVGYSDGTNGRLNIIRKVRVSTTIECSGAYLGGIVGHSHSAGHDIQNCLFDGTLKSSASNAWGGAIIGWGDSNAENYVRNCFERGTYEGILNADMCWVYLATSFGAGVAYNNGGNNFNNWSAHGWGVSDNALVINTAADWEQFRQTVEAARGLGEVNAILNANISVNTCVGGPEFPYCGTFNGNGHTLNVNIIDNKVEGLAPFRIVGKSTFKNLRVIGDISGGIHSGGLIGETNDSPVRIENLYVAATVQTSDNYAGGVIGHAGKSDVYIEDCMSYGIIRAQGKNSYGGGIIGWAGSRGAWEMHRVYANVSFEFCSNTAFCYWNNNGTAWGYNDRSTTCVSKNDWNEVRQNHRNRNKDVAAAIFNTELPGSWMTSSPYEPVMEVISAEGPELSADDLLATLGSGWAKENDNAVPMTTSFDEIKAVNLNPTLPTFYHESIGKIDPVLKTETRQSSVLLVWETDGNPIDYFTVLRRIKGGDDTMWQQVATNLDQMSYEDTTVSPLEEYEYKVRATNDCEGTSFTETQVREGFCKHTGLVEGYVRFNDGTGVPDITVEVTLQNGGSSVSVKTDEKGYFMADDLSYMGQKTVTYVVTPVSEGNIQLERESYSVTFNDSINHRQVHEFTITNGLNFNAYVMYDGTSIPVKGAHFMVNGRLMHNATGAPIETDFEGRADFHVLGGVRQKIQAVMPGHTFTGDGYYKSADGVVLTDKVSQTYFYDATLVKLTGRVVGGKNQGSLPLDNNLSRNNLGDNLTMVLTLEGDNTSWLVFDNQNPTLSVRQQTFAHSGNGNHKTMAEVQRKRMIVKPDSLTGEYVLMLPPVRWKVQQVYCDGYPTLFQDGQVSEVIDLTECLTPKDTTYAGSYTDVEGYGVYQPHVTYNAMYSRIYHAPVEITYRQLGYDTFDYFGDKTYTAQTLGGDKIDVPLAYKNASDPTIADYTFGYPVFSLERRYPIQISVVERYPWNGVKGSMKTDVVRIGGGSVTIHNSMANKDPKPVQLDSLGQGIFTLTADKTTRLLTSEDALKTVTMTLTQDGTTYEAEPLQGYVLNMFSTGNAKDVLVNGQPQLIDILRDPPGGGSTATLSKGSKLKYTYTLDMKLHAGLALTWTTGTKLENFQGIVVAPEGDGSANGIINSSDIEKVLDFEYAFDMEGKRAFAYTMNVNQDITTSSAATMVGADADLYIGMVQNMVVAPMSTIRAIPDSLYQQMLGRLGGGNTAGIGTKYGSLVHIAEGRDADNSIYHLVRDESIGYGPKVESQFVHSQKHILTELIPKKVQELRDLMFTGTASEAQTLADATGKPVYRSLVDADDENFAVVNTKGDDIFYYTSTMEPVDSMNYVIHLPVGTTDLPSDEVAEKCQVIYGWVQMIAENEHEKLFATEFMDNYDVDGGSKVTYSEQFESEYTISNYYHLPGIISGKYFDETGADMALAASAIVGVKIVAKIVDTLWGKLDTTSKAGSSNSSDIRNPAFETRMGFYGKTFKFRLLPTMDYDVKDVSGESKIYSRKESFTISMDPKSHLNFDLYRTQTDTTLVKASSQLDVFSSQNFADMTKYVETYLLRENDMRNARYARGFVYRTRGGATANPWEGERRTLFHEPGTLLDERTKKISNPKITLDKQSVSGVAIGDPARFKVYLTNESEQPESATGGLTVFTFFLDGESNPKGAKIFVDGAPLTGSGTSIVLYPGKVLEKTMEVYAGEEFDYEGLKIGVASSNDFVNTQDYVSFDVHYLHEAGPVLIAQPGDKWVMNTNAQYDEKRGWFLPVTINGFNKHQHNFDHIEFQYKESLRGDDSWTNLCSYFADSLLMVQASGVKEMIPENGNITTHFYGEGTVMEKPYDLRAVLYCRNGNSFLTTSSPVISGVKDTRRPQLFGTPEPRDGVLSLGDDIIFNFSEDIEHNYLSAITNFEVKGEVNNNNVAETVSLLFDGKSSVETEARRNFSGKSLTVDLMVKPDETGRDMPIFSHGTNRKKLQLWLTKDFKLKAVVDDQEYVSDSAIVKGAFTQVAMSIDMQEESLTFYNGGKPIGKNDLKEPYNGTGTLIFGRTNENDPTESEYYEGRMMEARLWYRALTGGQVGTTYGSKRLTGFEMGLVDYYPMNEGTGNYALDKTQGANATLKGASWAMPRGLSLRVEKNDKGIALTDDALNRTPEQDYTLMMWFKTDADGRGVLVSNGAGRKDELNAVNQFCLGFEAEKLLYKTNGMTVEVPGEWSDGMWHHLAMTVNRSFNVANIYVDNMLRTTFAADSLGGISGGYPLIGAARYSEPDKDGHVATIDTRCWLTGYIDELCLFEQALPLTLIQSYATRSPKGDESGLLTYLSFDQQERQKDNDLELVAYPYSKKIYLDDKGDVRYELDPETQQPTQTPIRDFVFVGSPDDILKRITDETAAPVVPNEELKNLNFSFVGKDNQVYVDLKESNARLNRRNIYVTLREVEDRNGNAMASPQTACYYVTNSSLQWLSNRTSKTVDYGYGEELRFTLYNNSAASHTYTITNCPSWLTLDKYSDRIAPKDLVSIVGKMSKNLNVGTYDEVLYLTDEEGISEPLYLTLIVEAELPDWAWSVSSNLFENSMNIVGRVYVNDEIDIDNRDIVGAFDRDNVCHGFTNVNYSAQTGESNIYLTVYDDQEEGRELFFKLWQYSTGHELLLSVDNRQSMTFLADSIAGIDKPVELKSGSQFVQVMNLKQGWNWLSFNVKNEQMEDLNVLLDGLPWQEGDMLTELNGPGTLLYENGHWLANEPTQSIQLSHKRAYAVKVSQDIQFAIAGEMVKALDERTIWVNKGWNAIGYTPMQNLTLETALSDYYDKAQPGDVIKSHDAFAYFYVSGSSGRWRGNLEYLKPGEGYMLLRKGNGEVSFRYPFYEPGSTFLDEWAVARTNAAAPTSARTTMSVSAVVEGFAVEEGDVLIAFANGERVGEAFVSEENIDRTEPFYMSIAGNMSAGIWFAIERDGDIIAATDEQMEYKANAVIGSPDEPTPINFVHSEIENGKWYTLSGIHLGKRPTLPGAYIYNGKKIIIK